MPYDSNGNSTINRNRAVTGQTVQAAQVNVPFDDVQSMLSQVLLRSGVAPMAGPLNMNSFKVTGIQDGSAATDAVSFSQATALVNGISKPWAGYISPNFNIANNVADSTNDIDFPAGMLASSGSDPIIMTHSAATVQLDVAYGTGSGGRFDSAISDGTWHCFIISNGTTVSRGFSKSLTPTGQANYPSGYTYYRRVASILRSSGAILGLVQREDDFELVNPITDRSSPNAMSPTLQNISIPAGIVVKPKLNLVQVQSASGNCQTAVASPGAPLRVFNITTLANEIAVSNIDGIIFSDTSSHIQMQVALPSGSLSLNTLQTFGWVDTRGRS